MFVRIGAGGLSHDREVTLFQSVVAEPAPAPQPVFRSERLVLESDFAAELAARGLEVGGLHELPLGGYTLELVPAEDECTDS